MRRGHDLEAAMAMALVDLGLGTPAVAEAYQAFRDAEAQALAAADRDVLRRVQATRVDIETF